MAALVTTTLASAMGAQDTSCVITSATSFAAGNLIMIDQEFVQVAKSYVSGTTIPLSGRGLNGTFAAAHPSGANAVTGAPNDFSNPAATTVAAYPLAGRRRKLISYSAAGAITLPASGDDMIAVINGTSALAMTIAAPTKDNDGSILFVVGNGAANHTVTFTGGLSGAGSSYDVITVNSTAPICVQAMAINGLWTSMVATPMAGTVTNITGTVA